jgi:hypothetical protein
MYNFAIVAMLGLAVWKFVGMLLGFLGRDLDGHVKAFVTLVMGVVAAELLDYHLYAGWGASFRNAWMDPVFTGLTIGGFAYVWHHCLGVVEAYGRRNRDEAREIERRTPHAA